MALVTPTLSTERLRLRPFEQGDADQLYALMSDSAVMRFWDSPAWTDPATASAFVERSWRMAEEESGVRVVIEGPPRGACLGWISLASWDHVHRSAEIGYVLAETARGRGFATEGASAMLGWAFEALAVNRIQARADTRNQASRNVLERLGFLLEGTLREDCVVDGVTSDSWVYGLLRRNWELAIVESSMHAFHYGNKRGT